MEHDFHCNACGHRESWTTEDAAQAASVWHVYLLHPELWYATLAAEGETFRDPQCPMPETLGRRFEAWESQL